jgi:hypothetical protein
MHARRVRETRALAALGAEDFLFELAEADVALGLAQLRFDGVHLRLEPEQLPSWSPPTLCKSFYP